MEIRTESPKSCFPIDQSSLLIVPTHVSHDDESKSAIYDTLALFPDESLLKKTMRTMAIMVGASVTFVGALTMVVLLLVRRPRASWL